MWNWRLLHWISPIKHIKLLASTQFASSWPVSWIFNIGYKNLLLSRAHWHFCPLAFDWHFCPMPAHWHLTRPFLLQICWLGLSSNQYCCSEQYIYLSSSDDTVQILQSKNSISKACLEESLMTKKLTELGLFLHVWTGDRGINPWKRKCRNLTLCYSDSLILVSQRYIICLECLYSSSYKLLWQFCDHEGLHVSVQWFFLEVRSVGILDTKICLKSCFGYSLRI